MDEFMVTRWNSVVEDQDIVYHLGDCYFADGHKHLPRLKGRKRLILGNHDNAKDQNLHRHFQKISMWRMFPEYDCLLSHVPVHESSLFKVRWNLHGHIHQQASPTPRHINCSVEVQDYIPKLITDLVPKIPAENG
jgi:calcineurin-like phosphoesterase family protein